MRRLGSALSQPCTSAQRLRMLAELRERDNESGSVRAGSGDASQSRTQESIMEADPACWGAWGGQRRTCLWREGEHGSVAEHRFGVGSGVSGTTLWRVQSVQLER